MPTGGNVGNWWEIEENWWALVCNWWELLGCFFGSYERPAPGTAALPALPAPGTADLFLYIYASSQHFSHKHNYVTDKADKRNETSL